MRARVKVRCLVDAFFDLIYSSSGEPLLNVFPKNIHFVNIKCVYLCGGSGGKLLWYWKLLEINQNVADTTPSLLYFRTLFIASHLCIVLSNIGGLTIIAILYAHVRQRLRKGGHQRFGLLCKKFSLAFEFYASFRSVGDFFFWCFLVWFLSVRFWQYIFFLFFFFFLVASFLRRVA